jgi:hypothetical protein
MTHKYIIFYKSNDGGCGNAYLERKKKIKQIYDIREIEETLHKNENIIISLTNYKYIGWRLWK